MDSGQIDQQLAQDLEVKTSSFMAILNPTESIETALYVVYIDYLGLNYLAYTIQYTKEIECTLYFSWSARKAGFNRKYSRRVRCVGTCVLAQCLPSLMARQRVVL